MKMGFFSPSPILGLLLPLQTAAVAASFPPIYPSHTHGGGRRRSLLQLRPHPLYNGMMASSSVVVTCCLPLPGASAPSNTAASPAPAPAPPHLSKNHQRNPRIGRRDLVLRSSELATLAAIFHFSGTKPSYLGVQKSPPSLALCPATNNCVSTSEKISDSNHYAPPWNYNPKDGRRGKPISKDEAMKELIQVVTKTKPDNFTPRVVEKADDYVRVEYESPIFGFVDDVEFWFPPGKKSVVEYRTASRSGFIDFNVNKKRVKELRLALEKKGWASESTF